MTAIELDTSIVSTINNDIVVDNNPVVVSSSNLQEVNVEDLENLDITISKKEYTIVGDDIYIPQLYDDAPQWMKDLVGLVVDVSMTTNSTKLINDINAMLQEFAVSYVPLNQYTQSILDLGNEDMRLNALIETLNSNFNNGLSEANAQIIDLKLTKASKEEVVAQVIQTISAQLADPDSNIGATIGRLDRAIATEQQARALSMSVLTASIESVDADVIANAEVVQNALAYVGIDEAGASTNTGLSAYLEASDGTIGGADSQLANTIRVTAEGVESKWAYNSTVNVNGVYRNSGFGLTTNNFSGDGTQANPYVSEFWIDATKLRFTNSASTGSTAPFTIDATGATPQITFNGNVSFTNVTGLSTNITNSIQLNNEGLAKQLGYLNYANLVNAYSAGTTIINGGYINTGLIKANGIVANQINTTGLVAENISATEIVGKTISGSTINGAVINGAVIRASYLDLDGQLEVLTNYHITPSMYNANPGLYVDAVWIAGANEYRIPSISTVKEPAVDVDRSWEGAYFGSKIRSFNCAIAGHNEKAISVRPFIVVTQNTLIVRNIGTHKDDQLGFRQVSGYTWMTYIDLGNSGPTVSIYCFTYRNSGENSEEIYTQVYLNGSVVLSPVAYGSYGTVGGDYPATFPGRQSYTFSLSGVTFRLDLTNWDSYEIYMVAGYYQLTEDFTDIYRPLINVTVYRAASSYYYPYGSPSLRVYTNSTIQINNMV